jgi:hypothetical protein
MTNTIADALTDQPMPDDLLLLFDRCGLDVKDLPSTEADCSASMDDLHATISDIDAELRLDLETGHRDNDWRIRATHARRHKYTEYVAIKAWRRHLISSRKRQIENMQAEISRQIDAHKRKQANSQMAYNRVNAERQAYRRWIAENMPEQVGAADAAAKAARDASDRTAV